MTERQKNNQSQIVFYQTADGQAKVQVRLQEGTVWLPQQGIATLFNTTKQNISLHVQNIYEDEELLPQATVKQYLTVQAEGNRQVKRLVDHYNLEMILAVGYRVRSQRGTEFRKWATRTLKEYVVKGFVLDDDRLKQGGNFGEDYFDELLERIRDIRASERRFYQKITDIYAQCSVDYDPQAKITQEFYATVQNKLHWAIHGHTAAELIVKRADAQKLNMGLTTWKSAPKGKIRKSDITIAKNYLSEKELRDLNLIVTMYLDYAELQARSKRSMTMQDWKAKLDAFLKFNERRILQDSGSVSADIAEKLVLKQFDRYSEIIQKVESQKPVSDFDKLIEETSEIKAKKIKTKHKRD